MKLRSTILVLLLTLTVFLVLIAVAASYLLFAYVLQDQAVTTALQWTLGVLAGLISGNLALLVIALAVERVLPIERDSQDETNDLVS